MEAERLLNLLRESTRRIISNESAVAVAYSGGLDSSVLAAVASESSKVRCHAGVVRGSFDARNVEERARSESLDLRVVVIDTEVLVRLALRAQEVLGTLDPVRVAYTIPILAVLDESAEKLMLVGNGADELLGGYAKYVSAPNPKDMMRRDLLKMLNESERLSLDATRIGKRIGFPFASEDLIAFAESLPMEKKIGAPGRKLVLRDVARLLGLPSHDRPKKAAQYSSGVMREMDRLAGRENKTVADWIKDLAMSQRRSA